MILADDEIHLWFTHPDKINDTELLNQYTKLLSEDEIDRNKRFVFKEDRHNALITRALNRWVLSQYIPSIQPQNFCFSRNDYGKPEIRNAPIPIHFNISHTKNFILFGVVMKSNLGVDVEYMLRKPECVNIARRFFSSNEADVLEAMPEEQLKERFFDYWTLKEAYTKASGIGLSMPWDQFGFLVDNNTIKLLSTTNDETPEHWWFSLLRPTCTHRIAIAVCNKLPIKYRTKIFHTIPLQTTYETRFPLPTIGETVSV